MVVESKKLFFDSIDSKFFKFDSTRTGNTTPTLAHVKRSQLHPKICGYGHSESTI